MKDMVRPCVESSCWKLGAKVHRITEMYCFTWICSMDPPEQKMLKYRSWPWGGAGHQLDEAGGADMLLCVLLQLLGGMRARLGLFLGTSSFQKSWNCPGAGGCPLAPGQSRNS